MPSWSGRSCAGARRSGAAHRPIRLLRTLSTWPRTCARSSEAARSSATPPTGRSTSGITRWTARATSSSTSTRSGRTTRSTSSASTTTCRSSDWRDGLDHLDAADADAITDLDYLRSNIDGGEGYDWFYASSADREAQVRTPDRRWRRGQALGLPLQGHPSWWSNPHRNRPGGVESGTTTAWMPESKPIRFTEIGCPAVDRGPNQPNVFYDPKSAESFLPYFSRGWRDDAVQRRFLEAVLGYWAEPANNPVSGVYGGRMITTAETAAWTWDARPVSGVPGPERRLDRRRQLAARALAERSARLGLAREPRARALPPCRTARRPDRCHGPRRRRARLPHLGARKPTRLDRAAGAAVRLRCDRERGDDPLPAARPATGRHARARRSCGRRACRRRGHRARARPGDRAAAGAEVAGAERRGGLRRDDRRGPPRHRRGATGDLRELRARHHRQRRRPALPPHAARRMGWPRDRVVPAAAVAARARPGRCREARSRRAADLLAADLDRRCRRAPHRGGAHRRRQPLGWRPDPNGSRARRGRWSTDRRAWRSSTCRSCARASRRTSRSPPPTRCLGRAAWPSGAARARTASSSSPPSAGPRVSERSPPTSTRGRSRASISATWRSSI